MFLTQSNFFMWMKKKPLTTLSNIYWDKTTWSVNILRNRWHSLMTERIKCVSSIIHRWFYWKNMLFSIFYVLIYAICLWKRNSKKQIVNERIEAALDQCHHSFYSLQEMKKVFSGFKSTSFNKSTWSNSIGIVWHVQWLHSFAKCSLLCVLIWKEAVK